MREALRRLDAEGLVRVVPNQGAYVIGWTATEIAQMYDLRAILESHAAELATPCLTAVQIDRIAVLAELTPQPGDRTAGGVSATALAQANRELHATIVEATANHRLASMIASVSEMPMVMRALGRLLAGRPAAKRRPSPRTGGRLRGARPALGPPR